MSRIRLVASAFLFLSVVPGCGMFSGDRRNVCERWRDWWNPQPTPVAYPMMDNGCAVPIAGQPYGGGAPIIMGGPPGAPFGAETLPQPGFPGQQMPPKIPAPKIGIDEGKGKQFELEGRTGPIGPALPVNGVK
ncbi:MAG TPA: hypothetical protein VHR66_28200 [Gemmataceae bacterium]|jgi:hypothetical protein|nr:hypothetical protein [Gemmataceae bacterium]